MGDVTKLGIFKINIIRSIDLNVKYFQTVIF